MNTSGYHDAVSRCVIDTRARRLAALLLFCFALTAIGRANGQLKSASSAGANPTSSDAQVPIDQAYKSDLASEANLDPADPQLSTDGFLSDPGGAGKSKLASAECLLTQTLLAEGPTNRGFPAGAAADFCKSLDVSSGVAAKAENIALRRYDSSGILTSLASQTAGQARVNGRPPAVDYALIHIVIWSGGHSTAGPPTPTGTWYLFSRKTGHAPGSVVPWHSLSGVSAVTTATHLLGDNNVAFLSIHLGIDTTCGVSYDIKATHTTPLNRQDFSNLIQTAISVFGTNASAAKSTAAPKVAAAAAAPPSPSSGTPAITTVGIWGGEVILKQPSLPASIAFTPSMKGSIRAFDLKSETPPADLDKSVIATCSQLPKAAAPPPAVSSSLNSSRDAVIVLTPAQNQQLPTTVSYIPIRAISLRTHPSIPQPAQSNPASNPAGSAAAKDPLAGLTQTIANEGPHHFDFSIAMPITSYKSLKYDSTNSLLVPKTTTSLNPYALFDFYPDAVDLAAYSGSGVAVSMPKLSVGIPIGNQPLQKPFVGGGFMATIKSFHFQPIVGLHIQREIRADSATSTTTHTEWHAKLQVMIGFSIADARKVLGIK